MSSPPPHDSSGPSSSRRRVLAAVPALLAGSAAGCTADRSTETDTVAGSETSSPTATDSDTATGTRTPTPEPTLAARLREYVVPLTTTTPGRTLRDLRPMADRLSGRAVVGLGEATHGTREFFQLKHRLVRLLVEELGCRVFAWEANFSETLAIDRYVRTGTGDPESAVDNVYFWTWDTESVLTFVEWLRSFNEGRPPSDRVRFYGFDMQAAVGPARAVREYVRKVAPGFLDDWQAEIRLLLDGRLTIRDREQLAENVRQVEPFVRAVRDHLRSRKADYVSATSESAWELATRHVRILEQKLAYSKAYRDRDRESRYAIRDRSMAENVAWIREYESADLVPAWAHNLHVSHGAGAFGDVKAMGEHLAARYGEGYYAVGQEFGHGSFQAYNGITAGSEVTKHTIDSPPPGTVPAVLSDVDGPQFVLDVDAALADERLAEWLRASNRMHDIGAVFRGGTGLSDVRVADSFDALTFVEETTRARPVNEGEEP